jgi:hypothetical protein
MLCSEVVVLVVLFALYAALTLPTLTTGRVMLFGLLVTSSWVAARGGAHLFALLDHPPEHEPSHNRPARRFTARFRVSFVTVFVVAGLTTVGKSPPPRLLLLSAISVVSFGVIGVVMLFHVQYASKRQLWKQRDVLIGQNLTVRWIQCGGMFVSVIAIIAVVATYSPVALLLHPVELVLLLVFGSLGYITAKVLSLTYVDQIHNTPFGHGGYHRLGGGGSGPAHVAHHAHAVEPTNWTAIFSTIAIALVVAIVALVLLRRLALRSFEETGKMRHLAALFTFLDKLWRILLRLGIQAVDVLVDHLPENVRILHEPSTTRRSFTRVASLPPREQVFYYYLNILRRANRHGIPRLPFQTPHEYGALLEAHLPDMQEDVNAITEAFVKARYSRTGVKSENANNVQMVWRRLRDALRQLRSE